MRKVSLLAASCMALALVFAPVAMAQGVSPEAGTGNPYGCPDEAPFVATAPGDPGEGSLRCFATQAEADAYSSGEAASPSASASASASPAALEGIPQDCDNFASQFAAQQFYDFNATPEQQAAFDPDGNGFACDGGELGASSASPTASPSASASATAESSASALPETGGPVSAMALVPLVLLVGTGVLALRVVRHS